MGAGESAELGAAAAGEFTTNGDGVASATRVDEPFSGDSFPIILGSGTIGPGVSEELDATTAGELTTTGDVSAGTTLAEVLDETAAGDSFAASIPLGTSFGTSDAAGGGALVAV
jgi:hypothetical protein